ncbi:hypothetical protein GY45DRAFT_1256383 [Cubamyces sp. BRFM 1775]|nr:hypothetical protein GY45DRAFT_1256383 [Cubamyces sp. BRFM 1775]
MRRSVVNLPQEIVDHIVGCLATDETSSRTDLTRTALVARAWYLPSQRHLHRTQLLGLPLKTFLSRLEWFRGSHGQRVVHHVREVQFWRLDADEGAFLQYWAAALATFPNVHEVGIHFHDAALQMLHEGDVGVHYPTFPSVTTLRLSKVAFATCRSILSLIRTLPNLTSIYVDRGNWACDELVERELARCPGQGLLCLPLPSTTGTNTGPYCNGLALRHLSIDCTEGLDPLECTARHIDIRKLVSLDIALPTGLGCSTTGLLPLLLGITLPRTPQDHIQKLLSSAEALETLVYRLPPHLTHPGPAPSSPRLRHFAIRELRLDLFAPTPDKQKLHCFPAALAAVASPCLETVSITLSVSEAAQLDHVPWEDVDRVLSNAEKFARLRECAFNVAVLSSRERGGRRRQMEEGEKHAPSTAVTMAEVRAAIGAGRLPRLEAQGKVGVYEAEDFTYSTIY